MILITALEYLAWFSKSSILSEAEDLENQYIQYIQSCPQGNSLFVCLNFDKARGPTLLEPL